MAKSEKFEDFENNKQGAQEFYGLDLDFDSLMINEGNPTVDEGPLKGFTGGKDPVLDKAISEVEGKIVAAERNAYGNQLLDSPELRPLNGLSLVELNEYKELEAFLKDPSVSFNSLSHGALDRAPKELDMIAVERDPRNILDLYKITPDIALKALEGAKDRGLPVEDHIDILKRIPNAALLNPKISEIALDRVGPQKFLQIAKPNADLAVKALDIAEKQGLSETERLGMVKGIPGMVFQDPRVLEKAIDVSVGALDAARRQGLPEIEVVKTIRAIHEDVLKTTPVMNKAVDASVKALQSASNKGLPEAERLEIMNAIHPAVFQNPKVLDRAVEQIDPRKIIRGTDHGKSVSVALEIVARDPIALSTALKGIDETLERRGATKADRESKINSLFESGPDGVDGTKELKALAMECVRKNPAAFATLAKHSDVLKGDPVLADAAVKGSWKNLAVVDRSLMGRLTPTAIEKAMVGAVQNQNPEHEGRRNWTLQVGIVGKGFNTQNPAFQDALAANPSLKPMVEGLAEQRRTLLAARANAPQATPTTQAPEKQEPGRKTESTGRFSSPPPARMEEPAPEQSRARSAGMTR